MRRLLVAMVVALACASHQKMPWPEPWEPPPVQRERGEAPESGLPPGDPGQVVPPNCPFDLDWCRERTINVI